MPSPTSAEMANMVRSAAHDVERAMPKENAGDEVPMSIRKRLPKDGQAQSTVKPYKNLRSY